KAGRVVVGGEESLLEAILTTNGQPALILYGQPGPGYAIEGKPRWETSLPWQVVWEGTQSNLLQQIQPVGGTNRIMFFRPKRTVPTSTLRLEVMLGAGQTLMLRLHGQPGDRYVVESKATLDASATWQLVSQGVMISAQQQVSSQPTTNRTMFFRATRQ